MASNFQELSYQKHIQNLEDNPGLSEKAKLWLRTDTANAWRLQRMYRQLDPLLALEANSTWVTIGDGRYGLDAKYIADHGIPVVATNITSALLKEGKEMGIISDYQAENAESLTFTDEQFDYAFCKEAYHHFPRPMIALYEMLRVAKKGVVLMEPNDYIVNKSAAKLIFLKLKNGIKKLLGRSVSEHQFEPVGNYVFSISVREAEKVALGLNFPVIAYRGLNDAYLKGLEKETLAENGLLWKKVKFMINRANFFCRLGLSDYMLITIIIFKEMPDAAFLQQLAEGGFTVSVLPKNPHVG